MMLGKLMLGAAAGGAAAWFLKNNDAAKAAVGRYAGQLKGAAENVAPGAGRAPAEERLNDPALVQKVESEIFRDEHIRQAKGHLSINAEYGVIYVRGEVPSTEVMSDITMRARKVDGVKAVENLTHLPGEEPPHKDEARHGAHLS
jgi:osmotically-inducible protein OsmY